MTEHTQSEGEPVIRDKRRLDPQTGELRADPDVGETAGVPEAEGAGAEPAPAGAEETDELTAAKNEALDLADQLARAKAENYNLDQRFNAFVKRSRTETADARARGRADVVEALISVLDDVDLARQHGELDGPFASIAEKLESTLTGKFGVVRFGEVGEGFDPEVHEALMHTQDEQATSESVQTVLQPGYKVGERVIRPARVAVVGPA